jgi:hypothetical protein
MVQVRHAGAVLVVAGGGVDQDHPRRRPHQPGMDAQAQETRPRVHRARPELAHLLHGGRIIRLVGIEDTRLDGIERQSRDLDDCGIAYAVGSCCGHIATFVGRSSGARLKGIDLQTIIFLRLQRHIAAAGKTRYRFLLLL